MVEIIDTTSKKRRNSRVVESPIETESDEDGDFYDALDSFQTSAFRPSPDTIRQSIRLNELADTPEETKAAVIAQLEPEEPLER